MTVFQVLLEMIAAIKFFGLIAPSELVDLIQVRSPGVPVWRVWEFLTAVAAGVSRCTIGSRVVEGGLNG